MSATQIAGAVLLALGLAGFFTGGFSFVRETSSAQIGPIKLQVQEKESMNIPQWLSIGAMLLGGVLLVVGARKK